MIDSYKICFAVLVIAGTLGPAAAAPAIKPNFAQLFMTFGDFAPYRQ